jgi:hypothetical protein
MRYLRKYIVYQQPKGLLQSHNLRKWKAWDAKFKEIYCVPTIKGLSQSLNLREWKAPYARLKEIYCVPIIKGLQQSQNLRKWKRRNVHALSSFLIAMPFPCHHGYARWPITSLPCTSPSPLETRPLHGDSENLHNALKGSVSGLLSILCFATADRIH